ncbi:uncharacterized protein BT62DRAFT_982547 [Guyanagaster necrorhizus]|uniref:DDE-1 domain-containing protein n=1 Tax=Guyanagaster necrorhizus TaxID=856835 RepID=A0A9P8AP23_9AGAR|nr:uncharacterized protein BT62DRAFT_982547 [Guyanagaster necrorhizus MCA 3950]KAG7442356.1 hypothetical protein BT62DRAFT_982547 [Guyanagaster necrorhizus MCA 3950]
MADGVHLNGEILRQKWTWFADLVGVPQDDQLALSEGWLSDRPPLEVKESKKHLTYVFTINASGSEKHKSDAQLRFYYHSNAKSWMTTILLLQDNFSAHSVPDDLTNIHVVNFAPNLTAYVDASTIHNCWCQADILPDPLLNPIALTSTLVVPVLSLLNTGDSDTYLAAAEKEVSDLLSHLWRISVLQSQNMMAIDELIDFALEWVLYDDGSDEDIFDAIKECRNAEQEKEMNSGDNRGDNDVAYKKPSQKEVLAAASTLQRYVADVDEPFAHKLETVLTNFGCQTHLEESMELTTITDYFSYQSLPYL